MPPRPGKVLRALTESQHVRVTCFYNYYNKTIYHHTLSEIKLVG